jgi:putative spermidine/putrescine transport system permease protein
MDVREWLARRKGAAVTALLLLPAFLAFFGLFFYPFVVTFVMSLRPEGQETGWTLEHYVRFLSDPHGRSVVALTFGLAIATTVLSVLLSVPLSLVLRRKLRGHRFFRIMILVPMVVPGLIAALGLLLFYGPRGWFILFLRDVLPFAADLRIVYTLPGLTLFYVWLYFPYTCLTTLGAVESIDPGIEEAAEVAGANRWKVLRHILLPLMAPGILSGSVLTFMAAFGAFSIPLVAGGNYRPLAVEVYKQIELFIPARWSQASAMAVLMGVMQVVFLALYMRFMRTERVRG